MGKEENGQLLLLFGLLMPVLIAGGALAFETGYVYMAKNQLQQAADAAVLAGIRDLVANDFDAARTQAVNIAQANSVAGSPIVLDPAQDIEFGRWQNNVFTPDSSTPNAMRVTARRSADSPGGPLPLYFARIIGLETANVTASAIAMLNHLDLALVLDRSSSMDDDTRCQRVGGRWRVDANGIQPIDTMRSAAKAFIDDFDSEVDSIAVISYASTASNPIERQLTSDFGLARSAVEAIPNPPVSAQGHCPSPPSNSPIWYTHIGDGMDKAIQELTSSRSRVSALKVMVLLSDGQPTCTSSGLCGPWSFIASSGRAYARQKADEANSQNITIYTISLGTNADRDLMQDIAQRTGGYEFFAARGADLSDVFKEVRSRIPARLMK